ncbi:hypothetical protein CEXT_671961 [Caerostris extrusa]|uniref:Uncharacterized protein n=1 Tax=Caerostris extrusa TaxID=172846 RepID=A0AAV4WCQ9_CAEEX|nr:hypothetical protein CEXT_671961 [Caerostris extrusa]
MGLFLFVEEADFTATNSVLSELQGWRDVLEWMEQAGSRDCKTEFVWMDKRNRMNHEQKIADPFRSTRCCDSLVGGKTA